MQDIGDNKKCGICNLNTGETFCVRCKRAICDRCWDKEWDLCADCATYKRARKWDFSQAITNALKIASCAKEKLSKNCNKCVILRDHLLYLLKKMKDIEYTASTEAIPEIEAEAKSARAIFTDLSIGVLMNQKMKAVRDLGSKL